LISSVVTPSAISARARAALAANSVASSASARGSHGRADAAAGARDLLVARALQPQLELGRALAAVDQVGVAVDQPRGEQRAAQVELALDAKACRQRAVITDPGDAVAVGQQRAVFDQAPACGPGQRGQAGVAPQGLHAFGSK
jgi:hypothetical protein